MKQVAFCDMQVPETRANRQTLKLLNIKSPNLLKLDLIF